MKPFLDINGVEICGICSCLPERCEDNLERCKVVYGDEKKAESVVKATGIKSRRVADAETSSLDLCVAAAKKLLDDLGVSRNDIAAVINVTFTPERQMPCNACQAQSRLDLPTDIVAFDINLACSGWIYGLYVASMMAKATSKKVLLLDGDVQTRYTDAADVATVPVLADAGTATLVSPVNAGADDQPWRFAFLSNGAKGEALSLPFGGKISMDGLGVFKFVTMDVLYFIRDFLAGINSTPNEFDAFVPHQANVFMIQQIAKKLGFLSDKLWVSGDVFGNSSSASVPTTIAHCGQSVVSSAKDTVRLLVSGFGGGLSAAVAAITLPAGCKLDVFDYKH